MDPENKHKVRKYKQYICEPKKPNNKLGKLNMNGNINAAALIKFQANGCHCGVNSRAHTDFFEMEADLGSKRGSLNFKARGSVT